MLIDTHAHLFFSDYNEDLDQVISRAADAGVEYIIVPSTSIKTAKETIAICERYPNVYGTVGVHPHDTKDWETEWVNELKDLARHPKIIGIGEIGLDYYYDFSPKAKQHLAFRDQIELALELKLPVVVHNRESDDDMMEIIKSYKGTGLRAQFHCFNGTLEAAREYIKMHHYLSFVGNITFKKMDQLREVLKGVSLEHLMLETDSPFMTPMPFRGKRNEPAYVRLVAGKAAEVMGVSVEDIERITSYNVFKFFGIGSEPGRVITYRIGNNLYINVTNRCNADCIFCDRKGSANIYGYNLKMKREEEPNAEDYIKEIGDPKNYNEIVFCGYGEPTIRWDVIKQIGRYVKDNGGNTRLNTNGHGNVINKRNIAEEMGGIIDIISVSLNAVNPVAYSELMKVDQNYFNEMINFIKEAKKHIGRVVISMVDLDKSEEEKGRQFAEQELKVEFRVREFF
jgi:TatD DNase family protein